MKIDINSDMGEGFGAYRIGDDEALMGIVSSANVACGFHAGDPIIMDRTVRMAKARGVGVGAHPGLPDLLGFGRRVIQMDAGEVEKHMLYQIGALQAIAANAGHRVTHVSFHAAMGNMVNADSDMPTSSHVRSWPSIATSSCSRCLTRKSCEQRARWACGS
jgi:5-oxoprolinase (ATP-hydrolysing) subunit A